MQTFPLNNDKTPACKTWQTYIGEVHTPMFGVSPPDGFYILDLDGYKTDRLKEKIEQGLGCSIDWDGSHIQNTINGGSHHAFIIPEGARMKQGSDLLKIKGFDTRASGRGYIASGEGYTVIDADNVCDRFDDFLPELPLAAFEILKAESKKNDGDNCEVFTKSDLLVTNQDGSNLTKTQLIKTLQSLPSEIGTDNESWMKVCAGFKRQMLAMGVDEEKVNDRNGWAFKVLSAWSKERYEGDDEKFAKVNDANYTRWKSFGLDDTDMISFKSIVSMSGGVEQSKEIVQKEKEKKLSECSFIDEYVMDAKSGKYIHKTNLTELCRVAFDNVHLADTPLNSKGQPMKPSAVCEGVIQVTSDVMYAPSLGRVFIADHDGRTYLNSYREPTHINCDGIDGEKALDIVKSQISHLITDKREQELILYYLAHNIQNPGKKIPWGIILQGAPGDGKSFFSEMMRLLMGLNNVRVMNADTLQSAFSGWAAGQCMVFIEELKLDNFKKYEIVNRIKPYISNPTVEWVRKGKDPLTVPNTSNYFCFTNYKDAIPLDATDRRYAVFFSRWQGESIDKWVEDNQDYYPDLYDAMRENIQAIYCGFMNIEIPKWFLSLNRAPKSAAKTEMIELTKSEAAKDVDEAINDLQDKVLLDDGKILNVTVLGKQIEIEREAENDHTLYANFPDPVKESKKLVKVLESLGWVKIKSRRRVNNILCSVYKRM